MRKYFFLTFILLLIVSPLSAQTISGMLLDSLSQEPISYAHIYIESLDLGTVSNELGEFELKLPEKRPVSLIISHISYSPIKVSAKNDTVLNILMSENIIYLHEVEVKDKAFLIAKEVLANLRKAEGVNYGKAFYRQLVFQDTQATEFIEAFYDISFNINGVEEIKVNQARFARKKHDTSSVFISHTNFSYLSVGYKLFSAKGETSVGKPFAADFFELYEFTLKEEYKKGLDSYAVIEFTPSKVLDNPINSYGYFIYNTSKKCFAEYNVSIDNALGADKISKYAGNKELKITNPKHTWKISFSNTGNLIDYILVDYRYDLTVNNKVIPSHVSSKMVFYEKNSKPHKKLRKPGLEMEDVSIFEKAKYNPKFWRDNPIIKRTPKEEEVIATFEKENAFGTYFK